VAVNSQLTLVELAKRTLNNMVVSIAEVLSKTIQVLEDAVFIECNKQENYTFTRRLGLPTGSWRQINAGVSEEASITQQVTEGTGLLESYSTIDTELVKLAGNTAAFRNTEDVAFLEGLTQTFGTALLYGNIGINPEQIQGWAVRYASTGTMIKSAGGSGGDTTSAWIVQWGETKCHMLFPQGSDVGMSADDLGEQTVLDGSSNPYQAYRTLFKFHPGFAVHDNRTIGRVVNIESTGAANLYDPDKMIGIINEMIERASGAVIYVNSAVMTQVDIQAMDKSNVYYFVKEIFGVPTSHFRGIPIKQFDSILNTETAI